jgi:hypothetical protein
MSTEGTNADGERRIYETPALDLPACLRMHHIQPSRPFTIKKRTYQVCFECGREFEYSWALMHSLRSSVADNAYAPLNTVKQADVSAI